MLARRGIFAVNPTLNNGVIDAGFNAELDNDIVYDLISVGGDLLIGGEFDTVGGTARRGIARINASTGSLETSFDAQFSPANSDAATALIDAGDGINIYAAGPIFNLNDTGIFGLVKLNRSTGAVDTSFNPHVSNQFPFMYRLYLDSNYLWLCGDYTSVGAITVGNDNATQNVIIKLNSNGEIDTTYNSPLFGDAVFGVQYVSSGNLVVRAQNTLYYFDINSNSITWSVQVNSQTQCMIEKAPNLLLFGGSFSTVTDANGTVTRNRMFEINEVSGLVTSSFSGAGFGFGAGTVNSMYYDSSTNNTYVVGTFTTANDGQGSGSVTRNRAAAFNPDYTLNTLWNPNLNGTASVIASTGGDLFIGGSFTTFGGSTTCRRLCRVDN